MRITIILLFISMLALPYCTTTKQVAGKDAIHPVYYDLDIAPIIEARCTPCHFPAQSGKKLPLDSYASVSDNIADIIYRVELPHDDPKFMPFKSKKEPLSDSLITVLKVWKESGMKEFTPPPRMKN